MNPSPAPRRARTHNRLGRSLPPINWGPGGVLLSERQAPERVEDSAARLWPRPVRVLVLALLGVASWTALIVAALHSGIF